MIYYQWDLLAWKTYDQDPKGIAIWQINDQMSKNKNERGFITMAGNWK